MIVYIVITLTLFYLMKQSKKIPWVLIMCVIGIIIGITEDFVSGDKVLLRLSEQYPDLKLRFFNFPKLGLRKTIDIIHNP